MKRTSKMTKGIFTMLLGLTVVAFTSQALAQTTISFSTAGPGTVTFFVDDPRDPRETSFQWFDCPGSFRCETDSVTLEPDVPTVVRSVAFLQVTRLGVWSRFDREDAVLSFDFTVSGQTVTLLQDSFFQFVGPSSDPQWRYIAFEPSTTETIDLGGGQLLEVTLLPWGADLRLVGEGAEIRAELVLRGSIAETISSNVSGNLTVGPGETVLLTNGARVSGNVNVNGGTFIMDSASTVRGNVESIGGTVMLSGGASVRGNVAANGGALEITGGSTVFGNLETQNATTVTVTGSVIKGNVLTQNNQNVTIMNNTIQGNIDSTDDGTVTITGNTVSGNLQISNPTTSCTESSNMVNGTNSGCP